ncbi:MAG TPA: polysaccharide lyase family protein [Verrucomicrobiae bacterium]|nr:polysaccharide lyase family protein [Verrucomicrobiae bacterium]
MKFKKLAVFAAFLLLPLLLNAETHPAVTVSEDDSSFTLDNGIVTTKVSKRSGDMTSLTYKNLEMLDAADRQAGYWEHNTARGQAICTITIDPKANGGERGEVSVKGISNGMPMGSGPGGSVIADIEIRYTLGRGDSGIYTYSIFSHPTNYPATSVGESRYCMKLNDDLFDWMTVDANRNMQMITTYDWNHGTQMNMKEARRMNSGLYQGQVEHKYDYSANQFDVRAWGWSSSKQHVGIWLVNPSVEYLSGGPTKFELSSHRDATFNTNALDAPAPPTLLNYWRGSHYGGSICNIAATDAWTKVIGPFLIYCNAADGHDALWHDALAQADKEAKAWPFDWVSGVDYPHKNERATVSGRIVLNDPQAPGLKMKNLLVGLSAPDYAPAIIPRNFRGGGRGGPGGFGLAGGGDDEAGLTNQNNLAAGSFATRLTRLVATNNGTASTKGFGRSGTNGFRGRFGGGGFGLPRVVDWQTDAKNYEFWVRADDSGNFKIPNVRPGTYSLHAIADGVLGDLTVSNVVVDSGKKLAMGKINWQPVRYGKQLWDIGTPNRNGSEFFKGDDYFHWGWYLEYPKLFPYDVKYVIGKSDFHRDWFFEQVPFNEDTNNTTGNGRGSATTWTVTFDLPAAPHGKATLRLAICGVGTRTLAANLNDQPIGSLSNLVYNATINRDGIGGYWGEHDIVFDAALMKQGKNVLGLTVPAGGLTSGIIYDYLRLELDENGEVAK